MKRLIPILLAFFISAVTTAQVTKVSVNPNTPANNEQCHADQRHTKLMNSSLQYRLQRDANEQAIRNMLSTNLNYVRNGTGVLVVPVVVHVIHEGEALGVGTNISDAQVLSAIAAVNDDYRKVAGSQGDGAGVDCEIEFCLATTDPNGNGTSGINRIDGSGTVSGGDDYGIVGITDNNEIAVKNLSKWPNGDYYNIWVVNEIDDNDGGFGTQGYAYFPGASSSYDGAVVLHNAFGFDANGTLGYELKTWRRLNRTLTHELGHALNLDHTFNGDANGTTCPTNTNCNTQGDNICDTDPHIRSGSNCPSGTNACTGNPNQDIVRNYLDYSDENCKDEFSQGQKDRMRAALCTSRASLLTSSGCNAVSYCIPNPSSGTTDGDFIDGVALGNINNTGTGGTTGPNYTDYTAQSTTLLAGTSYSIDVTGGSYAGDTYAVWIDYNQDNDFVDPDEFLGEFVTTTTFETQAILFTVPTTATSGTSVMRVRGMWPNGGATDPCTDFTYGETEDYGVTILSYCIPNPLNGTNFGNFIDGVALGSISNTGTGATSGPNYTDYTAQSTTINVNASYNLGITSGSIAIDYYGAWIDYNQDGDFADSGEKLGEVQATSAFQSLQIPFTVPGTAVGGETRLRVRGIFSTSGNLQPCIDYTYGETEDYTVDINAVACGTIIAIGSATDPTCGNSDGMISVTPSGGNAPYTYSWNTGATTSTISNLGAGTYTINITDTDGCPGTGTFSLTDNGAPTVVVNTVDASCFGTADGTAIVSASGGTAPYTYSWSNGLSGAIVNTLSAGTYSLTVEGSSGCAVVQSVTISSPASATLSTSSTDASCGASDGTASAIAFGGAGGFTYLWDLNAGGQMNAIATNLSAGSYDVTATDSQGCTTTATVAVSSAGGPTMTVNSNNVDCFGNANGTATAQVSGGTLPYTYTWSNGNTSPIVTSLIPGVYTVTVSDASSCANVQSVTISEPNPITINATFTLADCSVANGGISVAAIGGTPTFGYAWSTGTSGSSISAVLAGSYTVTATDLNGCTADTVLSLGTNPGSGGPTLTPTVNDVICAGDSTGSVAVSVSTGTSPFTYQWSNGLSSAILLNLPAGSLALTVTDVTGCSNSTIVTIDEPTPLDITWTVTQPNCGTNDGEIATSVSGGNGPYFYFWPDGQASSTATGLAAGIYNLTVQDIEGCELEVPIGLNNDPNSGGPTVLTTINDATCHNTTDGSAAITVSSGTAPYTFQWADGETSPIRLDIAPGSYYFTVTDASGCLSADSLVVGGPPAPTITSLTTDATCNASDGSATVVASGGTPAFIYFWDASTGFQTGETATGLAAGTYSLTITESNGCETTETVAVNNLNAPTVLVSGTDIPCFGGDEGFVSLNVTGGTAPYVYAWSNGTSGQNLIGVTAGVYTVTVTDDALCAVVLQETVVQPDAALNITSNVNDVSAAGNCDGSVTASVFGGTEPYSYQWNDPNGSTQSSAFDLCVGDFEVIVTDAQGCVSSITATVAVGSGIGAPVQSLVVQTYPNPTTGRLMANIEGATGSIQVRIFNSTGQLVATSQLAGPGRGMELANLQSFSQGLYVVEVQTNSARTLHRIQLLK